MSKIETFLKNMHVGHVFIFILSLIFIEGLFLFLFGWKKPLSINNPKTLTEINLMLENEHPNCEFSDMCIHTVVFTYLIDSILVDNPHLEGEIEYKTKTVFYDRINDEDTVTCATIFEIDDGFLKEKVGKVLYTINDTHKHCYHKE